MIVRLVLLFFPLTLLGQYNCNPYHKVHSIESSENLYLSVSYVSCFHTQAIMYETGTSLVRVTGIVSGKEHNNTAYLSLRYFYEFDRGNISAGPLVELNNNRGLGIGHLGSDFKVYKRIYFTSNLIQRKWNHNYLFIGAKIYI